MRRAMKRWESHGHSSNGRRSKEYTSWARMLDRCTYPGCASYRNYGARGIRVCERWRSFSNFLLDMGPRPHGTTLDRINNNGDYEPGNCRWAPMTIQILNTRPRPNKYGFPGVYMHRKKFSSAIKIEGKKKWLGTFGTAEEASVAYMEARAKALAEYAKGGKER